MLIHFFKKEKSFPDISRADFFFFFFSIKSSRIYSISYHILLVEVFFFSSLFVSFKVNHFSHLYDQQRRKRERKKSDETLFDKAKIDTLPTLQKKTRREEEQQY